MSEEGESISVVSESGMEDSLKTEKQLSDANGGINGSLVKENVTDDDRDDYANVDHDQLLEMVIELKFQNEILKSQFEGLKTLRSEDDGSCQQKEVVQESRKSVDVKELYERIESLSKELHEEKETRGAAEKALEHLRVAYSEADAKAQEFSTKLAEGQILYIYAYVLVYVN